LSPQQIDNDATELAISALQFYLNISWDHDENLSSFYSDREDRAKTEALVENAISDLSGDGQKSVPFCGFVDHGLYIQPNANVAVCCSGGPNIGSLHNQSIEEMWIGPDNKAFKRSFIPRSLHQCVAPAVFYATFRRL